MIGEIIDQVLRYAIELIIMCAIGYTIHFLRLKVGADNFGKYLNMARIFVESLEQELGAGMGADKKAEAMQLMRNVTRGKLSDDTISRIIESAVFEMNTGSK
jgi:hypothetical protein